MRGGGRVCDAQGYGMMGPLKYTAAMTPARMGWILVAGNSGTPSARVRYTIRQRFLYVVNQGEWFARWFHTQRAVAAPGVSEWILLNTDTRFCTNGV